MKEPKIAITKSLLARLSNPSLLSLGNFIDGQWQTAHSGQPFEVRDPANGECLALLPSANEQDARDAISSAEKAGASWSRLTGKDRAALLLKWHDLIIQNADDLALLMTLEQGKPLSEAKGEIAFGASFVTWYAEEAKRVHGEVLQTYKADRRVLALRQPIGVVVAITPWNFPSAMITRKCAPAIAAGCTIVLKPSEETPLSAIALISLAAKAGIPAGVINLLLANREDSILIGKALLQDSRVRKLSFTGSTATGKHLMRLASDNVLKLSLELGGNAPLIVFEDADLDRAADGALSSKFRNMGQTCTCANRIFVHSSVYQSFTEKLIERVQRLQVGSGLEEATTQGPMINEKAVKKVESHICDALEQGAKIAVGGKRLEPDSLYFTPTVLVGVKRSMRIFNEETFGPVAPLIAFDSEEEVVDMANDTNYGLSGYFYTRDINRIIRVAERLEFGAIGVNEAVISSEAVPIGGVKESGLGREGARHGIEEFLEIKQVTIGGLL